VLGKNGVRVNGVDHKPGAPGGAAPVPLHSQSLLQIGEELTMYFLLPKAPREVATAGRKRGWVGSLRLPAAAGMRWRAPKGGKTPSIRGREVLVCSQSCCAFMRGAV
jgi:hypothetical protein